METQIDVASTSDLGLHMSHKKGARLIWDKTNLAYILPDQININNFKFSTYFTEGSNCLIFQGGGGGGGPAWAYKKTL